MVFSYLLSLDVVGFYKFTDRRLCCCVCCMRTNVNSICIECLNGVNIFLFHFWRCSNAFAFFVDFALDPYTLIIVTAQNCSSHRTSFLFLPCIESARMCCANGLAKIKICTLIVELTLKPQISIVFLLCQIPRNRLNYIWN